MIKEPPIGAVVRITYQNDVRPMVWQHKLEPMSWDADRHIWITHGYGPADWAHVIEGAVKVERAVFIGLNLSGKGPRQ